MKTRSQHWARVARALGASFMFLVLVAARPASGQTNAPGLSVLLSGTNQVTLTVTNGTTNGVYDIWWTEFLDTDALTLTNGAWVPVYPGTTGQTNFVLDLGDTYTGFFRALNGLDWDLDGVPNTQDARPFDASIGLMRVTIESPANGSNVP